MSYLQACDCGAVSARPDAGRGKAIALVFDTDDLHDGNHRLDLLVQLKEVNPAFKLTAFAVPGLCTRAFLDDLPPWIELVPHGFLHPHPMECSTWTRARTEEAMDDPLVREYMTPGWKSPGWQVSDGTYEALRAGGWWIADHPDNDRRRPEGLLTHVLGSGDHVHTHVQNVCGNGLEERFNEWAILVEQATEFQYVSEAVTPWQAAS